MIVDYNALELAVEYVSVDVASDSEAFLDTSTGTIYYAGDCIDEALPDDIYDNNKYVCIPSKRDLDLGRQLVFRFTEQHLPNKIDKVYSIFRKRGAYSKFKSLLAQSEKLEKWYEFEGESLKAALLQWCEENDIQVNKDEHGTSIVDNTSKRTGVCLCGSVQVSVNAEHTDLGACHCTKCQKWAGGPLLEIECGTNVQFHGEQHIATFRSSEWAERGFCKLCGSHLFIKDLESGEFGIPAGLFECPDGIQFNRQVFIDHKPTYYSFADNTTDISSDYIYQHFPQRQE